MLGILVPLPVLAITEAIVADRMGAGKWLFVDFKVAVQLPPGQKGFVAVVTRMPRWDSSKSW